MAEQKLTGFEDACRKAGLRLTPQRIEIYRELARASDHPSAETLYRRLIGRMPTLSLDTVYRTLTTLVEHGMVSRVETVESQARFEAANLVHHHLVCEKCRKIMDFHWQFIDDAALPESVKSWGKIERKTLTVYGTCQDCLGP